MFTRILTLAEFAAWYKVDRRTVVKMITTGELPGMKMQGRWRIPDIGPVLIERARQKYAPLAEVPLLRGVEAAQLMQISTRRVRKMAETGTLNCEFVRGRRVYALSDILAAIKRKKTRNGRKAGSYARADVMAWAKTKLAEMEETG